MAAAQRRWRNLADKVTASAAGVACVMLDGTRLVVDFRRTGRTGEIVMAGPIRVLVMVKGFTEAWYQLSNTEQESWWDRLRAIGEGVGGKWLVQCDSRWANEEYLFWGVLEYPTLDAWRQAIAENEKEGWYRYVVSRTLLGSEPSE